MVQNHAVLLDGSEVRPSRHHRDVMPPGRETSGNVAADRAGAEYADFHADRIPRHESQTMRGLFYVLVAILSPSLALAQGEAVEVRFVKPASSLQQVGKAIKLSLVDRDWELQKESETSIQAIHRFGRFTWFSVVVTFDQSKATIAAVDSSGNADARMQSWTEYLAKDISANLQRLQILFD